MFATNVPDILHFIFDNQNYVLYQNIAFPEFVMHSAYNSMCAKLIKHLILWNMTCILSHTWVRYPGFSGHGVKCPILTTVVSGFSVDLIDCTIRSKWGSFGGSVPCQEKSSLCVKSVVSGWKKYFPKRTRLVKPLWGQIVHMQQPTNDWKNLTIFEIMGFAGTQWLNLKQWGTDW